MISLSIFTSFPSAAFPTCFVSLIVMAILISFREISTLKTRKSFTVSFSDRTIDYVFTVIINIKATKNLKTINVKLV